MSTGRALAFSALIVTIANFLGRIFGFIREMVIANKFGASAQTDAFLVSFTIPNIIYSLVVMGALSASFIPIFTGLLANEKEKEAWRLAHTILNILLIVFGLITAALLLFAPQAIFLAAPGFGGSNQLELGASLLRIMAPALIFMGISGLMASILNSHNHFAAPSMVALVQNIVVVGFVIAFAGKFGIFSVAIGFLISSIGQVLIQLPILIKKGFSYRPVLDIKHEDLSKVVKLFIPVLIGLGTSQSNTIIDKWMASFLADGSISYLNYAFKVGSLPLNTLIAAVAIVLFPTLSKQAAKADFAALKDTISAGVRMIALVAIPSTAGLYVLSMPITRLLFEHGAFGPDDTFATGLALAAYSFGMLAMGVNMLIVRCFYALNDGATPLKASIFFIFMLVGMDILLIRVFSHVGLAIGYSLAVTAMLAVLFWALQRRLHGLDIAQITTSLLRILAAAIAMGIATWIASSQLLSVFGSGSKLQDLLVVALSGGIGVFVYIISLILLKANEVLIVWDILRSKVFRSRLNVA